jgi:hypothetical protein
MFFRNREKSHYYYFFPSSSLDQRSKIEELAPILEEKNIKLTTFWKGYALKVC